MPFHEKHVRVLQRLCCLIVDKAVYSALGGVISTVPPFKGGYKCKKNPGRVLITRLEFSANTLKHSIHCFYKTWTPVERIDV